MRSSFGFIVIMLAAAFFTAAPASAHPHVWVTMKSTLLYAPDGTVTGVRHAWAFDDMFSTFALQGIKHEKKGEYTREELKPLAEVNVTSLREYDFFTFAEADGKKVAFAEPVDYWLDYNDSVLTLNFTLPLKTPVAAKNMRFEIYDPTVFVEFAFAKGEPVSLSGAPSSCNLSIAPPRQPTALDMKRLSELDANPLEPSDLYGQNFANKVSVNCS